jgi:hypothetical protein
MTNQTNQQIGDRQLQDIGFVSHEINFRGPQNADTETRTWK